jgi:hypothetical protein
MVCLGRGTHKTKSKVEARTRASGQARSGWVWSCWPWGMRSTKGSQPGRSIEFDHRQCWPWEVDPPRIHSRHRRSLGRDGLPNSTIGSVGPGNEFIRRGHSRHRRRLGRDGLSNSVIGSVSPGNESSKDSQPASAEVGPGWVGEFDSAVLALEVRSSKDSQPVLAKREEHSPERILSTSNKQDHNGRIAQSDFRYGCIGDGFTVGIGEADAAVTIRFVGLWNEAIQGFTAGIGEC